MPTARVAPALEMHYLLDDYLALMKQLGIERFHLIAASTMIGFGETIPYIGRASNARRW